MIPETSFKLCLKSRTTRSTAIHQDHKKRYAASYARGVALWPAANAAGKRSARSPRAVEARPARGEEENNLLLRRPPGGRLPASPNNAVFCILLLA